MNPFWIVWRLDGKTPTRVHASWGLASAEAERLAQKTPGMTFVILEAVETRKFAHEKISTIYIRPPF